MLKLKRCLYFSNQKKQTIGFSCNPRKAQLRGGPGGVPGGSRGGRGGPKPPNTQKARSCEKRLFSGFRGFRGTPKSRIPDPQKISWACYVSRCPTLTRKPVYQERGNPEFLARGGVVECRAGRARGCAELRAGCARGVRGGARGGSRGGLAGPEFPDFAGFAELPQIAEIGVRRDFGVFGVLASFGRIED
jgi:hypothetical protein